MKIDLDMIKEGIPFKLAITGDEAWLSPIYLDFPCPDGKLPPKITGQFSVARETDELYRIDGSINFVPWVECSRCARDINWNASSKFTYRIAPPSMVEPEDGEDNHEKSLSSSSTDLLMYENEQFDAAQFVNDQVQLTIPLQIINREPKSNSCMDCGDRLDTVKIYEDKDAKKNNADSPFSALAKLKL
jgi:uncharacterized metal-binding protein YceD (DUF177 family)